LPPSFVNNRPTWTRSQRLYLTRSIAINATGAVISLPTQSGCHTPFNALNVKTSDQINSNRDAAMSDIVQELRANGVLTIAQWDILREKAAVEIERLQEREENYRMALKYLADDSGAVSSLRVIAAEALKQ
jgi:hypothetical protein